MSLTNGCIGHWLLNEAPGWSTAGLLAHWSLDDNAGDSVVTDLGGNYNAVWQHGTTASDSAIGKVGRCLQFDGTNDYATAGSPILSGDLTKLSVSVWFKTSLTDGIMGVLGNFSWGSGRVGFTLVAETQGDYSIVIIYGKGDGGSNAQIQSDVNCFALGSWQHLVMTFDSGTAAFYINGSSVGGGSNAATQILDSSQNFQIGREQNSNSKWNGSLDSVMLFSRVLSNAEIQAIYNQVDSNIIVDSVGGTNLKVINCEGLDYISTGLLNGAVALDGIDDYLKADSLSLDLNPSTIAFAMKYEGSDGTDTTLQALFHARDDSDPQVQITTQESTDGNAWNSRKCLVSVDGLTIYSGTAGELHQTRWNLIALVYRGSSFSLYINGRLVSTKSCAEINTIVSLFIGSANGAYTFTGKIDCLSLWNRALTPEEVSLLFNNWFGTETLSEVDRSRYKTRLRNRFR